ncbi:PAS domain-containing protein [Nostoc sp. FACHB-152]|uniref:chemotaxis protein CheB n=1 Tax=unclassified Nostoc TaxID=2593658 RepID=UPI0016824D22|nr:MULTISPECIES: chemotaxis protein CheB [unclassified Nostoc]MBD2449129.1 PAS domain-containing protein [Nostoc sp. FACHB-152]MBD2470386.1 PAS domain-containing protein [Nostoc sp. FACHB-145]
MNSRRSKPTQPHTPDEQQQPNQNELFPIVGIGASAGGLEAFTQLLSHLPTDTGMGFVLVQHLSPDQKSMLAEILSQTTTMPVVQVKNGMVVEPNHVYVIPPNAIMTISQGKLQLSPRPKIRGQIMSVDTFFFSLAQERESKAIGVVLSGGDADGAKGLEAIKEAGGITFAQCQDSAQVSSMPNMAVASGQVDFVLTPQEIGKELANLSRHPFVSRTTPEKAAEVIPADEDAMTTIFSLLKAATGVDFHYYKQTTLKRRILRRMILSRLESLEDYVRYLQDHPGEVKALYYDVLITLTFFFRDPEAFEALKNKVFPIITQEQSGNSPIRVWVAGCSTGEEAYSLAICLLEYLHEQGIKKPIQIFATDINEVAIEKARLGIYKHSQLVDVSPERLQQFFVPVDGGYQINKPVRECCVFARQNLISDPPFSRLDLVTCRNVLIYLGSAVQKKLLPILHYGLKPTGFLMLGTSETVGEFSDLFALIDKKYKIYANKIYPTGLKIELIPNKPVEVVHPTPLVSEQVWNELEMQKAADQIILQQYAPVGVIIDHNLEIVQFRGQTSPYLQLPSGRPSFNLLKIAKQELRLELRTAIHLAKKHQEAVRKEGIEIKDNEQIKLVRIDVVPFYALPDNTKSYFLVMFAETAASSILNLADEQQASSSSTSTRKRRKINNENETQQLKQELATTKEYLQSIIAEQQATNQDLRAANEEILSSNEELQSTNEELETAKEEIQATNEELNTINEELQRRNVESTQVSNDLQNLLSSISIPILMLGGDLRIRRFTPVAERIFNLIPSDVGRPFSDINHNLNIPDLEQQILEVVRTLTFKAQEVQDNEGHWYDLRIRPYRTIDHKIDGAVVVLVDINELKRSARQITAARDYAEAIVATVRESLVVLDTDLKVITANQFFYEIFQVTAEETEQQLIYDLGNGQWNIPQLRSLLESILSEQSQFQDLEVEHNFEHIGQKILRLNGRKLSHIHDMAMILLVIEDITQQKQLEAERTQLLAQEQSAREAAERANRAKDEFLSILSHELRNPLNAMLGWANLLRTRQLETDVVEQGLEAIERSAQAQAHLISDLLDISRISSGRLRMDAQPVELAKIIEAAIAVVRLAAEVKSIEIQTQLDTTPRAIVGDPIRLQQVIWNLLSNAIKFTPVRGKIKVTLKYTKVLAQIQVSDTGLGIPSDFVPYIFDRFRQADGSKTRSNQGLGLGLAIVRHLVELHGGVVEAKSPGVGKGTTFTISLPLQKIQGQISVVHSSQSLVFPRPELSTQNIASLEGVRVLIVEDEADIRLLFKLALEEYGVQVTTVASASAALSTLMANPNSYDILLSDIGLPGEDGYSLIRQIRALAPELGGQIPAAALTAYAGDAEYAEALAAGYQMHIAKPIEPPQLVALIATLTQRM